jgi:large-conductance mechanosensitive channel
VEKVTPVAVEMINGQNLYSGTIMHETKAVTVIIGSHSSKIIFNAISSSTNPIIIRLSWFILHNLQVDWKMKNLHFESIKKTTPKYKVFLTSMLDSKHDSTHEDLVKTNQCM